MELQIVLYCKRGEDDIKFTTAMSMTEAAISAKIVFINFIYYTNTLDTFSKRYTYNYTYYKHTINYIYR